MVAYYKHDVNDVWLYAVDRYTPQHINGLLWIIFS